MFCSRFRAANAMMNGKQLEVDLDLFQYIYFQLWEQNQTCKTTHFNFWLLFVCLHFSLSAGSLECGLFRASCWNCP